MQELTLFRTSVNVYSEVSLRVKQDHMAMFTAFTCNPSSGQGYKRCVWIESENSSGSGTSLWITVGKMLDILKQTHSCSLYFGKSQKHILRTNQCHGRTGVTRPLSCFLTSSQNSPHLDSVISVFQRGKRIYPQKSVDSYAISFK